MSDEEFEITGGEVPTPEEFSLVDWVDGTEYPEGQVTVARNERAARQLTVLLADVREYMDNGEPETGEHDEEVLAGFRQRIEKLKAAIEASKVTFYLKGVPSDLIMDARTVADLRFRDRKKSVKTADQRIMQVLPEEEHAAYAQFLSAVVTALHVVKMVEHSTGKVGHPDADAIAHFYSKAPSAAQAQLNEALSKLQVAAAEYEQDLDEGFFPKS